MRLARSRASVLFSTKASFLLIALASAALARDRTEAFLWQHPGRVEQLDLAAGPGGRAGRPVPPFRFLEADASGSTPKVLVRDARGRTWDVKFGEEAKPDVFASRIVWAMGYYTEPSYFLRSGRITGVKNPGRADRHLDMRGRFRGARFELRDPDYRFLHDADWTWKKNPFVGTRELNGLRILVMLLSNWDNKDGRDIGSNTGVLADRRRNRWIFYVNDWGASMGEWGNYFTRDKWNCEEYLDQSDELVQRVAPDGIEWNFKGQHAGDFKEGIGVTDVRWLMRYLGRLSDRQLRAGLAAAGATPAESRCFARALRMRIGQLRRL